MSLISISKKTIVHFLLLLVLVSVGCTSSKKETSAQSTEILQSEDAANVNPSEVIVLCDVSNSVSNLLKADKHTGQDRIADMIKGCQELTRHYPPGSHIRFFLISSNAFEKAFLDIDLPEVYQTEKQAVFDTLAYYSKTIKRTIDSAASRTENNTCILTSLENGYNALVDKKGKKKEIILFSDMLEQCGDTPVGGAVMMRPTADSLLPAEQLKRFVSYRGSGNSIYNNAQLRIIMTTPYMSVKTATQVQHAWKKLFASMGIQQAISGNLIFEPNSKFDSFPEYVETN